MIKAMVEKDIRSEIRQYSFWLFIFLFSIILAIMFVLNLLGYMQSFQGDFSNRDLVLNFFDSVLFQFLGNINLLLLLIIPIIVQKNTIFIDTKRHQDFYFLAKVSEESFIVSKFLSSLIFLFFLLFISLLFILIVLPLVHNVYVTLGVGFLALFFQGMSYIAISLFGAFCTTHFLLHYLLSLFIILGIWSFGAGSQMISSYYFSQIIEYLGFNYHLNGFLQGNIRLSDIVYYTSLVIIFLFMAVVIKKARRY